MISMLVLAVSLLSANDALAPRLQTLAFHVERLQAIDVPPAQQAEKDAKMAELKTRVAAGVADEAAFNDLYRAIDAVRMWLWKNAADKPQKPEGEFKALDDGWLVATPALKLHWLKEGHVLVVNTPAQEWRFAPSDAKDIRFKGKLVRLSDAGRFTMESFDTGYSVGMTGTFSEFPDLAGFELRITANLIGSEIVFEVVARDIAEELLEIDWPKPIQLGNTADDLSVIPKMQGMLLPGNWPEPVHGEEPVNSRTFYMPWWGQIHAGHGVMTIFETPFDAGGAYHHSKGGPTVVAPRWLASLGRLGYQRTVRYVFDDEATYVRMAKRYRRFVQEEGNFVSLREKLTRNPNLDEVIGKPVVHVGALYHFVQEAALFNKETIEANHALNTFDQLAQGLETLKQKGIDRAYVHLDGWGFYGYDNGHPDPLPVGQEQGGWDGLKRFADTCERLGYFFAVHDQYRDFYLNAASFDDRLACTQLDGGREQTSTWCGGPQTILNPRFAPGYVRRNHDLFAQHGVHVRGAYLDVFSVVPLEECAQPAHPVTRAECAAYRRECFDILRARGYVVSSEESTDYLARSLDLVHHGPYATAPNLGGGAACGIPVPLFGLVYHDSLMLPWNMGENGGWGIPNGDAGRLHCLLNAGMPYVSPGADETMIQHVKEAAGVARRCAFSEMTNHEFLDDSHRKQRTTFSDGTQVTVDFDSKEYTIAPGSGK
jgi:hypothetical protein